MVQLSANEKKVRAILVNVAKGSIQTGYPGLITYKELWENISDEKWGMGKSRKIVSIITKISAYELQHNRPPLNELVVQGKTKLPGEPWNNIKKYFKKTFDIKAPYSSHEEAQEACWSKWFNKVRAELSETEVEEGFKQDRTVKFKKRNSKIVRQRKEKDNYTCQACGFRLKLNDKFIIDCHHKFPIGLNDDVKITKIDDLICLCPTCHRIAHTKKFPLPIEKIKSARQIT